MRQGGRNKRTKFSAVLAVDTSTVDDSDAVGDLLANLLAQPLSELSVDFLCLLRSGNLRQCTQVSCVEGKESTVTHKTGT